MRMRLLLAAAAAATAAAARVGVRMRCLADEGAAAVVAGGVVHEGGAALQPKQVKHLARVGGWLGLV